MHTKKGVSPAPEDKMQTCCFVISRSPVRVREVAPRPAPPTGAGPAKSRSTRDRTDDPALAAPPRDDLTGLGGMCPYPVAQAVHDYLSDVTPGKAPSTQRHDHLYARRVVELLGDVAIDQLATPDVYQLQRALLAAFLDRFGAAAGRA